MLLSVDEKSQMQALDRTQPGLPIKKGRCGTMTHDYVRRVGLAALHSPGERKSLQPMAARLGLASPAHTGGGYGSFSHGRRADRVPPAP